MNMNLRELYLADNKLNGLQDSAQLGNLLKFNYNIQILDLRNNHILDSGTVAAHISRFFGHLGPKQLIESLEQLNYNKKLSVIPASQLAMIFFLFYFNFFWLM